MCGKRDDWGEQNRRRMLCCIGIRAMFIPRAVRLAEMSHILLDDCGKSSIQSPTNLSRGRRRYSAVCKRIHTSVAMPSQTLRYILWVGPPATALGSLRRTALSTDGVPVFGVLESPTPVVGPQKTQHSPVFLSLSRLCFDQRRSPRGRAVTTSKGYPR
jgi:hypothetical protein